jgi:hypothetical protein
MSDGLDCRQVFLSSPICDWVAHILGNLADCPPSTERLTRAATHGKLDAGKGATAQARRDLSHVIPAQVGSLNVYQDIQNFI